ncbi:hypothetical protein BKA61DRAFT_338721 [Leptodontidium sp. MPI-SDFR-AT-0119]|nr:hypothetical protein BKA61DRAFT_338721 [Leptodontidium sp. MPI-SDFR-AT-0119]
MAQPYANPYVHGAALAARAAERRLAQQQAELRLGPNRDQAAIRDSASRPHQAPRPEARPERAVENRQHAPRLPVHQAVEEYRPQPAAAVRRPDVAEHMAEMQRLQEQISRLEIDFLERMGAERVRAARAQAEILAQLPAIPAARIIPIRNPIREPEDVRGEEAFVFPAAEEPRALRAVAVPAAVLAPARPYVPVRKPFEECYICNDGFDGPDYAIWCQDQCGTNVHRGCFEEWNRINEYARRKCGFCRRPWVEQL